MQPIVFVDIDGVLNNPGNYQEWDKAKQEEHAKRVQQSQEENAEDDRWEDPTGDKFAHLLFDKKMCERLNKITDATGAAIVISSSWRLFYGNSKMDKLIEIFRQAGVTAPILGPTPVNIGRRGTAIVAWLVSNRGRMKADWDPYVILDDEDESSFEMPTRDHLVRTYGYKGLTDVDVTKAIAILKGGARG
jgi:hypothetical protein